MGAVFEFALPRKPILGDPSGTTLDPVDVHIHLPTYPDPEEVVRGARSTGTLLVSCTVNLAEAPANLRLRKENPDLVRCFLGVHPSDAGEELPGSAMADLIALADGVGEIGLDPKYSDASPGGRQMEVFKDQLALAERFCKPVEVHSRGAEAACLEVLSTFRLRWVLMHWFEGEDHLGEVVSRGYYVSVGPAILYSKRVRRVASRLPLERLLTESDGPVSYKALGGAGGPSLIPSVVFRLSEEKRVAFDEMAREVRANADRFLGAGV